MAADGIELSRSEVANVADAIDYLIAFNGNTIKAAAAATGINGRTMSRFLARSACERVQERVLKPIAELCGISVADLIAGRGPKPERRRAPPAKRICA